MATAHELTTELIELPQHNGLAIAGQTALANWLEGPRFEHIQRIAKVFAESSLLPTHYRGKMADCIIGVQMAIRMGVDPMMFFQNSYIVHGKPGLEAKLLLAIVNTRGPFEGPIRWRFEGKPQADDWRCTAYAVRKVDQELCEATVTWKMVNAEGWFGKDGSKWKTMPEPMFRYRSASFLVRQFCPEITMGLMTTDELQDIEVAPPRPSEAPSYKMLRSESERLAKQGGCSIAELRDMTMRLHGVEYGNCNREQIEKSILEIQAVHKMDQAEVDDADDIETLAPGV